MLDHLIEKNKIKENIDYKKAELNDDDLEFVKYMIHRDSKVTWNNNII